jgi:hypothetical protein
MAGTPWQKVASTPDLDLYLAKHSCRRHKDLALGEAALVPTRTLRFWNPGFRHSNRKTGVRQVRPCWMVDATISMPTRRGSRMQTQGSL